MSEKEIRDMNLLDEIAEKAGGYVSVLSNKDVRYDYRKIDKYCKEKGIQPIDLTLRELGNFILPS